MAKRTAIALFFMLSVACSAQTDNTFYAKAFSGPTVGAKVQAAMTQCNPNTAVPCIIVIDPSLAAFSAGTMPTLCAQCRLSDYRGGGPAMQGAPVSFSDISANTVNRGIYAGSPAYCSNYPTLDQTCLINATAAATAGQEIDLPPGTINIASSVVLSGLNHYKGHRFGTVLKATAALSGPMLTVSYPTTNGGVTGGLEAVYVNCNNLAPVGIFYGTSGPISGPIVWGYETHSVFAYGCSTAGAQTSTNSWQLSFFNSYFGNNPGDGFQILSGSNAGENISFYGTSFGNNGGNGLTIQNQGPDSSAHSVFVYGGSMDYNTGWGIQAGTSSAAGNVILSVEGSHIESMQKYLQNYGKTTLSGVYFTNGTNSGTLGYLIDNENTLLWMGGSIDNGGTGVILKPSTGITDLMMVDGNISCTGAAVCLDQSGYYNNFKEVAGASFIGTTVSGGNPYALGTNGTFLGWNYTGGGGESDFFDNYQHSGGDPVFQFYARNGSTPVLLATLYANGFGWGIGGTDISSSSKVLQNCGTMTTTAAASNALSCSWVTPTSACIVTPNNSTSVAWSYYTATTGSVTVYHAATAGAVYSIACSASAN